MTTKWKALPLIFFMASVLLIGTHSSQVSSLNLGLSQAFGSVSSTYFGFGQALNFQILDADTQAQTPLNLRSDYQFHAPQKGAMARLCVGADQYFDGNSRLGLKGQILKRELTHALGARSTPMRHLFFRNNFPKMEHLCPRFQLFNDDQKLNFWIWYMAALARTESDCGLNTYNPNDPNGVSVGELQIPASWNNRSWRGVRLKGQERHSGGCNALGEPVTPTSYKDSNPPAFLMANIDNNLTCGVEVLAGVLCGFYNDPAETCRPLVQAPFGHGFWRKLKIDLSGPIIANIQRFPLCR